MLFNSPEFIFLFLPLSILFFFIFGKVSRLLSLIWLSIVSLFFYGYWNWHYLPLLIGSILFNYLMARSILSLKQHQHIILAKAVLLSGIAVDLILLGYYKYVDFFISVINQTTNTHYSLLGIILPLGISFFTFTQIAYLVDCYREKVSEYSFINYLLFVTYFPHLIAGPILHHGDMIPQFSDKNTFVPQTNFVAGLTMFTIGLFKKVIFADSLSEISNQMFTAAHNGDLSTINAWTGTLSYTLQIYYDFSGYSDMAIGLSILFGVRLPINFYSPYKSTSIIDFWRHWHMTLSQFLRDYLYIPLGGNKRGQIRRYVNLIVTMLLGGLWHGAGWTFIIWGLLHGLYLTLNHGWRYFKQYFQFKFPDYLSQPVSVFITFLCVMFAWVFFRSPEIKTAWTMIRSMLGIHHHLPITQSILLRDKILLAILLLITWFAPNSLQLINHHQIALTKAVIVTDSRHRWFYWRITPIYIILTGFLLASTLLYLLAKGDGSEFLYFEF